MNLTRLSLLIGALVFLALPSAGTAQAPRRAATPLQAAARALRALGRFREANAAYRDAGSAAPSDPAIQTAWGDLFLEKYNRPDALRSYQMALQVDARYVPALIGSARALSDDNPPQAIALAKRALEANPS